MGAGVNLPKPILISFMIGSILRLTSRRQSFVLIQIISRKNEKKRFYFHNEGINKSKKIKLCNKISTLRKTRQLCWLFPLECKYLISVWDVKSFCKILVVRKLSLKNTSSLTRCISYWILQVNAYIRHTSIPVDYQLVVMDRRGSRKFFQGGSTLTYNCGSAQIWKITIFFNSSNIGDIKLCKFQGGSGPPRPPL